MPTMMQYPANRKLRLMIRRAGTPMASMFSSAWKSMSSSGREQLEDHQSDQHDAHRNADARASTVAMMRFLLRAP